MGSELPDAELSLSSPPRGQDAFIYLRLRATVFTNTANRAAHLNFGVQSFDWPPGCRQDWLSEDWSSPVSKSTDKTWDPTPDPKSSGWSSWCGQPPP